MDVREELKSAGVYPTGPVSAWPMDRNMELMDAVNAKKAAEKQGEPRALKVKAGFGDMAKGLAKTAMQGVKGGMVSKAIRNERYETCKACPAFIEDSKRCSECGCFMEAKTWVNGDKDMLCPLKKWEK